MQGIAAGLAANNDRKNALGVPEDPHSPLSESSPDEFSGSPAGGVPRAGGDVKSGQNSAAGGIKRSPDPMQPGLGAGNAGANSAAGKPAAGGKRASVSARFGDFGFGRML